MIVSYDELKPGLRVVVTQFAENPEEGIENNLSLEPMAPPAPEKLAPHDVVIAIKSAGVSWVDCLMTSGQYQHQPRLPYCPGLEYSGNVVWIGSDVDTSKINLGDAVFVDCFSVGPRTNGDYQSYGGYASYGVAPQSAVRPIPTQFNFDEACNFAGNYETAYHCLIACGNLQAGETVLIHGASGSTGLAAVQIAKLVGATVIATGRSMEKLDEVKRHGADHILQTGNPDGSPGVRRFRDEVKGLTDGKGVDVVYDGVGGDISLESLRCVKFGARFLIVGWAATPLVAKGKGGRGAPNANMLPTNLIMMKGLKVLGCPTVISTQHDASIRDKRVADLMEWVEAGKLKPHISHRFTLDQAKDALLTKWTGKVIGGCTISPPEA